MDTGLPDGRRGQVLAAALTLTLLAAAWFAVASPLIGWYGHRAEALAQRRVLLRHMRDVAALLPSLKQQQRGAHPTAALLSGQTDALAAAAMQSAVQAMAAAAGVDLASLETLPAEARGAYRQIGLRVSLSASWPALTALLHRARTGDPRMLVDDLAVRPVPMRQRSAATPVNASFTLLAFRRDTGGKR